jgi:hypothetical protein
LIDCCVPSASGLHDLLYTISVPFRLFPRTAVVKSLFKPTVEIRVYNLGTVIKIPLSINNLPGIREKVKRFTRPGLDIIRSYPEYAQWIYLSDPVALSKVLSDVEAKHYVFVRVPHGRYWTL